MRKGKNLMDKILSTGLSSEKLRKIGFFWMLSSILGVLTHPVALFLSIYNVVLRVAYFYYRRPLSIKPLAVEDWFNVMKPILIAIFVLSVISFIVWVVTYKMTTELGSLNRFIGIGSKLGLVFVVIPVVALGLLFVSVDLVGVSLLTTIGAIVLNLISGLLLAIGFHRLGVEFDNSLLEIGGVILVLIPVGGGVLIGLGLRQIADLLSSS